MDLPQLPQLLLVGLVLVLGLLGVLVPGAPGTLLVWAGILWWALHERSSVAWGLLAGATALLLVVQVVKWLLPRGGSGGRRHPPDGGVRGRGRGTGLRAAPGGGHGPRLRRRHLPLRATPPGHPGEAWASVRAVMRAVGTSVLVELFACLLVVGAWVGTLLWA